MDVISNTQELECAKQTVVTPDVVTSPKHGLYVEGIVRKTKCRFLVDTGSTDTLISSKTYYQMPKEQRPSLLDYDGRVQQVDGKPLEVLGVAWVDIQVGRTVAPVKAIIAEIRCAGILGMDFLMATGGVLNFQSKRWMLNGESIQCTDGGGEPFVGRVLVAETTEIRGGHEAVVPGVVATKSQELAGPAIVEPLEGGGELATRGLALGRSLVEVGTEYVPLRVFNPGQETKTARKGTTAGIISAVEASAVQPGSVARGATGGPELPEHLVDLFERSRANVDAEHHGLVQRCLSDFQDVFSRGEFDIGRTDVVRHHINTGDARPIKERPRRHPYCHQEEIQRQVDDLQKRGLIEPSDSPWAANVVLVNKKDGTKRFCVDYRKLNSVTIKDAYPVPRIDETLDALQGSKWFCTLDLASGYWQVALDEEASKKSSFVVRSGLYRWKCMPFGLCNAPATFERLMEQVMSGLQWEILLIYLDDIIVFGQSVEETEERLRVVLSRLRDAGLKLKPSKCQLFQRSVSYLGHIVSADGVATDPKKVEAVAEWPVPQCVRDVRSFLGLASYYRKFIRDFAKIASPLHALTEKARQFVWSDDCQEAFDELKARLQSAPVLSYPIPEGDFILDTDASGEGIGGVLSQIQDGEERVLAYASRKLSKAERNYCVTRRELLAVVVYLKNFRQYLYGRKVTLRTDHAALRWLLNFKNPEGQLARWIQAISEYDVEIQHRPGKKHGNADGLSRQPCKQCGRSQADAESSEVTESSGSQVEPVKPMARGVVAQPTLTSEVLREAQLADKSMSWLIRAKESGESRPPWREVSHAQAASKTLWSLWDQLVVRDGLLYRRWESDNGKTIRWRLVMPEDHRKEVMSELHGGQLSGHLGVRKTEAKVRLRYYWPGIAADIRSFVRCCDVCARRKSPAKKGRAPLQQYRVGVPMERVALDLLGPLPKSDSGNRWILVVGDYCTKWMEAYPLPDATATTVALKLVNEFICRFGVPQELHSDRGTNFESEVFGEVCRLLGISKTRTTAYNPKSDGLVERFNKTLVNIVSVMIDPQRRQRDWDEFLPYATSAYRCTPQDSTGESPNMMMLGREVSLPIDLVTECEGVESDSGQDFVENLRTNMQSAHQRAQECLGKNAQRQKRNYDRRAAHRGFKEGQFVWLFNPAKKKGVSPKLMLRWEGPWLIVSRLSDVTFRIQLRPGSKPRVVHSDRLKPYMGEPLVPWEYKTGGSPREEAPAEAESATDVVFSEAQRSAEVLDGEPSIEKSQPSDLVEAQEPESVSDVVEAGGVGPVESPAEAEEGMPRRNPRRNRQLSLRYRDILS